jgi:RNA polymerase sigma-70 factor (ECF subfamily)
MDVEARWAELMRRAFMGDERAYERLLREVATDLRRSVSRRVSRIGLGAEEVDDIVQEVLLAVHRHRGSWDGSRPFTPWLRALVRHKSIDALRRVMAARGRLAQTSLDEIADAIAAPEEDVLASASERSSRLSALTAHQRGVVEALTTEGLTIAALAKRLSTTETAVRVTWHRALKRLSLSARLQKA